MPQANANGLQLEYETSGDAAAPAVLLIMGLAAQLVRWPEPFCRALTDAGYYVIRFDNRDIGLSTKLSGRGPVRIGRVALRAALGLPGNPPYTLDDMALDTVGLLDALGVRSAHVIGASMGGMIGQVLAARHPERVRSFVSIMSNSGSRRLPGPHLGVRLHMLRSVARSDREAKIQWTMELLRRIGSAAYPRDEAELRQKVEQELSRSDYDPGPLRQLAAIVGSPSRLSLLGQIRAATLILHGDQDPLVPVAAAYDLHRRIPGAQLEILRGMGHELPHSLLPRVMDRILNHLQASSPS